MQAFMTETQRILSEWEQRLRREGREDAFRAGKEDGLREGREDGLREGREVGERALVTTLLTRRFGSLSPEIIARLEAADTALLETWASRILDASTLEDVFAE